MLKFKKISENATTPTKGSADAAGYDLYSAHDCEIPPFRNKLVPTDLEICVPRGCYGRIAPRSGLALHHNIGIGGGVIDRDFRGNVGVIMFNHHPNRTFWIKKGERIAQLICELIVYPDLVECENLDATVRGKNGFGSTGNEYSKPPLYDVSSTLIHPVLQQPIAKVEFMFDVRGFFFDCDEASSSSSSLLPHKFVVKEIALVSLQSYDTINFLIKSPRNFKLSSSDGGRQTIAIKCASLLHGIQWGDGSILLKDAVRVLKVLTVASTSIFVIEEKICAFMADLLGKSVRNLKSPDLSLLEYDTDNTFDICTLPSHEPDEEVNDDPTIRCALANVQKYRKWYWSATHSTPKCKNLVGPSFKAYMRYLLDSPPKWSTGPMALSETSATSTPYPSSISSLSSSSSSPMPTSSD